MDFYHWNVKGREEKNKMTKFIVKTVKKKQLSKPMTWYLKIRTVSSEEQIWMKISVRPNSVFNHNYLYF
jgi:hypothetical protein